VTEAGELIGYARCAIVLRPAPGSPRWLLTACILTCETGLSVQTETGSSHGFSRSPGRPGEPGEREQLPFTSL